MAGGNIWLTEIRLLLALLAGGVLGGMFLGRPLLGFCAALLLVLIRWSLQLRGIHQWMNQPSADPPEGSGAWGQVLDNIYQLQRRNREAQLRLESALDYLQDSLSAMRDAAVIVDSRENIAWANDSANFLLGIKFPDDQGRSLRNLVRSPVFQDYFEADDYSSPLRSPPYVEGDRCLHFEVARFGVGDRLVFCRDITENYRLEQMRRDFVGNVSHELRTPLTVIKGYVDTLQAMEEFGEPRFAGPLAQMGQQTTRMENLVRDLLWLSRIESVETLRKTESLDMAALINDIVAQIEPAYPNRPIQIELKSDTRVLGDRSELQSALSNLVINALKYSEGNVKVCWQDEGECAVFSVTDRGIGIGQQHISRLTERFYRVDKSRSNDGGGTGLGLAIVKHVAASHQAELLIESELGVGSCFSLSFPAAPPP